MPELPDIVAYIRALESRIVAQPIQQIRLASPFLLRTAEPSITEVAGHTVRELRPIGKAYTGLTDAAIAELTEHFKQNTIVNHGRYREVKPDIVLEVAFDAVQPSTRQSMSWKKVPNATCALNAPSSSTRQRWSVARMNATNQNEDRFSGDGVR